MARKILEIFILFVLPTLLLYFQVIPISSRGWLVVVIMTSITVIMMKEKWSWQTLGFRTNNLRSSLIPYSIFTLFGLASIGMLAFVLGRNPVADWATAQHFTSGFLVISFVQEFAYRGFLMPRLKSWFSSPLVIISINAVLFAFLHIIFPEPLMFLPLGLITGYAFATIYHSHPNLYLITASHAILNYGAVMFCFFSFQTSC
jgi:uncharacterized protein